jgi:limonene 1,2-monooxygenase
MAHRMRFGVFLAPFHKPGINPTLALEQDLELIQWLGPVNATGGLA